MQQELRQDRSGPTRPLSHGAFPSVFDTVCAAHGWARRGSEIEIPLDGGRTQRVVVETFRDHGRERVRITTGVGVAAALSSSRMRSALRVNHGLTHGALAIRGDRLVLTDTFPLREATVYEVERALLFLARTADLYEMTLFGTDAH